MKLKKSFIALGTAVVLLGSNIVFSEPGSESDPLVTLSYVNRSIDQIKTYIDDKLNSNTTSNIGFEVVNVPKGQFLIANAGTEIILRSGTATAVISDLGGLTDVTAGVDLGKDHILPQNHLLIIPRDDGRGAYCKTDAIFMVRGEYEIR
ncbi:hypothetical protein [Tissierella sp. Yu-01]|uniref:hypothetical protein n=1 Tax=Tissierella sp. Yu-01 TaxID=3035694 RepID=UPI00240E2856|nr:hypothetical protein [Tissierella sp. Yu-01]WFA09125.1 hypothetical protein P3962_00725 [Tissierella sp. Yu-01]